MRIAGDGVPWVAPRGCRLRARSQKRRHCQHVVARRVAGDQGFLLATYQSGIDRPRGKVRVGRQRREEGDVGDRASDLGARKGGLQSRQRLRAVARVNDQLGDHRIVEGRYGVARPDAGLDAELGIAGCGLGEAEVMEGAGRWQEALRRVLGVDARLEGVPSERDLVLQPGEGLAGGDPDLPFDEVDACDLSVTGC